MNKLFALIVVTAILLTIISIACADTLYIYAYEGNITASNETDSLNILDWLTEHSTVVYTIATVGLFFLTFWQIRQLKKQHKLTLGFQMLEKRATALSLLKERNLDVINVVAVGFLFRRSILSNIREIIRIAGNCNNIIDKMSTLVDPSVKLNNKKPKEFEDLMKGAYENLLTDGATIIDASYALDGMLHLIKMDESDINIFQNTLNEFFHHIKTLRGLYTKTYKMMEEDIMKSIR